MKITREMLKAKGACAAGYREFCATFPADKYPDGVDYQEVLDKCAENDRDNHASWLLGEFGRTDDIKYIDGDLVSDNSIYVCGRLEVTGKIICKKRIEAGCSIKAGCSIEAGCSIKAGWGIEAGDGIKAGWGIEAGDGIEAGCSIEAGEGIKAGEDYGIYAGIKCRLSLRDWRKISAKSKPENIMCGEWVGK